MKSVVLIGMMGCGKSTCARLLGQSLGRRVVDIDECVVQRAGKEIAAIFEMEGEPAFRELETQVCRELRGSTDLILATGGGLVLRAENVELLRQSGVLVFLNRPAAQIFDSTSMAGRPLAQDGKQAFLDRFTAREPIYRACADLEICDFSTAHRTAEAILQGLHTMEGVL